MADTVGVLALAVAVSYLLLAGVAFVASEQLIFQPPPPGYGPDEPDLVRITTADGVRLRALDLRKPSAELTILYSHGNAEDIGYARAALEALRGLGFSVLAYDYRGYGLSEGRPSERGVYNDIDAAYDFLVQRRGIDPERIVVYGVSVGSGPAVELASRRPVGGLVLEAPFTTAFRVVTQLPLLPFDRFRNLDKIDDVDAPVLVMHGTDDGIIPFSHGQRLFEAAGKPKRRLWVPNAGHNNLRWVAGPAYETALLEFAAIVRAGAGIRDDGVHGGRDGGLGGGREDELDGGRDSGFDDGLDEGRDAGY